MCIRDRNDFVREQPTSVVEVVGGQIGGPHSCDENAFSRLQRAYRLGHPVRVDFFDAGPNGFDLSFGDARDNRHHVSAGTAPMNLSRLGGEREMPGLQPLLKRDPQIVISGVAELLGQTHHHSGRHAGT